MFLLRLILPKRICLPQKRERHSPTISLWATGAIQQLIDGTQRVH